jgi:hypothetical protein
MRAVAREEVSRHVRASVAAVKLLVMPTISRFYGIVIRMYFADHAPPHFHAVYGGEEAVVAIADSTVLHGVVPERALRLVREWTELHREELLDDWRRAQQPNPLLPIDPLP